MANNFNRDLYKILNVPYDASSAEIKASYRRLVHLYHPDTSGGRGDDTKFKEVQEAYEILSKPAERQKYDIIHGYYTEKFKKEEELKREEAKRRFTEQLKKEQEKAKEKEKEQKQKKADERRESFSKSINDALDNLFHTHGKSQEKTGENEAQNLKEEAPKPEKIDGADINTEVTISLIEALKGTERIINILHTEACPLCAGRKIINDAQCSECNGTGQLQTQKKINAKIAKGVKQGSKIRLKKEGAKGRNGGKDGDLYILINIEKDKYFSIDGSDIFLNLPVSVSEAALGAEIQIGLVYENITVKIPPNTSSGQKLRLTGMGLENKTKTKRGDCIITVIIKMPAEFTKEEKLVFEKLRRISSFDARKDFKYAK